jgi:hypothetical protein
MTKQVVFFWSVLGLLLGNDNEQMVFSFWSVLGLLRKYVCMYPSVYSCVLLGRGVVFLSVRSEGPLLGKVFTSAISPERVY